MTFLAFAGAEIELADASASTEPEVTVTGTVTRDTTTFRSGVAAWKCDSTVSNTTAFVSIGGNTASVSTTYFTCGFVSFAALPASTISVAKFGNLSARLTSGGKLELFNDNAGTQVGSDSAATVAADGTWYRIELSEVIGATNQTGGELRLDGTTVATASGLSILQDGTCRWGWIAAPGASKLMHIDDIGLVDNSGASNNTWIGNHKVALLLPFSDFAVGSGWTNDAGVTPFGTMVAAVNNTPPVGIADTTSGSGLHQIRNAASFANTLYEPNMKSYTAAGLGLGDTVNAILPWVVTGAPVTTSSKQGTVGVNSNPTIANIALSATGTAGAFWSGVAAGTYPTGWKWSHGTLTNVPSVALSTGPRMNITQVTSSTRIAMVCFIGMYVDYTPGVSPVPIVNMATLVTP